MERGQLVEKVHTGSSRTRVAGVEAVKTQVMTISADNDVINVATTVEAMGSLLFCPGLPRKDQIKAALEPPTSRRNGSSCRHHNVPTHWNMPSGPAIAGVSHEQLSAQRREDIGVGNEGTGPLDDPDVEIDVAA